MNIDQVLTDFRRELRSLRREGEVLEQLPTVTRCSFPGSEVCDVMAFGLNADSADEAILAEIAHFKVLGKQFEWKAFSFDKPPDLLDRLHSAGFTIGEREALVVYDLADRLTPFEGLFACEVRRVDHVDQLVDFRRAAEEIFDKDYSQTTNELADALLNQRKGHDAYIAYVGDEPVSVGRMYTDPQSKFAGFYGGGTLPQFRGRGCYRAVIAARARDAASLGARYLQVDAMPTSLPILLRLGFVHIADTWPCAV